MHIEGSHRCRCSSLPNSSIIHAAMLWMEMNDETAAHPVAIASKINEASRRVSPEPPTSGLM
ncbi:Uncharacterised protein [Mycobacteroides abscessus]|nr:Uncharacterised protein [Mycobacteroides abscessus]CQA10042.1 Uncharacterised protein [Mycobacteroides abscessus]